MAESWVRLPLPNRTVQTAGNPGDGGLEQRNETGRSMVISDPLNKVCGYRNQVTHIKNNATPKWTRWGVCAGNSTAVRPSLLNRSRSHPLCSREINSAWNRSSRRTPEWWGKEFISWDKPPRAWQDEGCMEIWSLAINTQWEKEQRRRRAAWGSGQC